MSKKEELEHEDEDLGIRKCEPDSESDRFKY